MTVSAVMLSEAKHREILRSALRLFGDRGLVKGLRSE